jgi:hypothetical protein
MVNLVSKTKVSAPFSVPLNSGHSYTLLVFNHNLGSLPSNVNLRVVNMVGYPGLYPNTLLYDLEGNGGTSAGWFNTACSETSVEIQYYRFAEADVRIIVTA